MSGNDDIPMVEDLEQSDEVRSLLRAGIDDDVSGYDFKRGLATHVAAVAALSTVAGTAAAAKAGLSTKALVALITVPVASATVIAALWLGSSSEAPAKAPEHGVNGTAKAVPVAPAVVVAAPAPAAVEPVPSAVRAPVVVETPKAEVAAVAKSSAPAPRVHTRITTDTGRGAKVDDSARSLSALEATLEAAAVTTNAPAETVQATAVEPAKVAPTRAEQEEAARQEAAAMEQARAAQEEARRVADERLKREMALLMQAKKALASDPSRALTLAMAGEQQFRGSSMFGEERQHVLVLALIKLGRVDEAERRAQPFLRAHPDSPFARRIRNALQAAR